MEPVLASGSIGHVASNVPLSVQDVRVLRLFAKPENSVRIAREMGITLPVFRSYLHSINRKLGTRNLFEAFMRGTRCGFI